MYHRILLAYDGSAGGRRALHEGAKLAVLCRAEVVLFAVVEISPSTLTMSAYAGIGIDKTDYERDLAEGLECLKALGLEPISKIAWGDPAGQIVKMAVEVGADLVVAGRRHKGPLAQLWSRSLESHLVNTLQCSVLIGQSPIAEHFAHLHSASG